MVRLQITLQPGMLAYDKTKLRAIFRGAGSEIAGVARRLMRQSQGGGRVYWKKGKRHQASAPSQPPTQLSGSLASSVKVRPFKNLEGVSIRDVAHYALFLESGARGGGGDTRAHNLHVTRSGTRRMNKSAISQARVLLPRPYLSTALAQRGPSIEQRIKESILQDIKFRRLKP